MAQTAVSDDKKTKRDTIQSQNGWGYQDSCFYLDGNNQIRFKGKRYDLNGRCWPDFYDYTISQGTDLSPKYYQPPKDKIECIPVPIKNDDYIQFLVEHNILYSLDDMQRVNRSHGHSLEDIVQLRLGKSKKRIPDIIVWPKTHDDVVGLVQAANVMNVVIIPIGGGTNVSNALSCPENETRCIVSLDTCHMNKILHINESSMLCKAQCGIVGMELDKQLAEKGFTTGHEPDSNEFSTLGGWVATRASGIKKNKYGNIEDIVVHVVVVTPKGVISNSTLSPRLSAGPDIHQFILGSEGTLGVITEITLKICPITSRKYGSMLFPDYAHGIAFMREVARQKCKPASIRLYDSDQFRAGRALEMERDTLFKKIEHFMAWKVVIPYLCRSNSDDYAGLAICYEGVPEEINMEQTRLNKIAKKFKGLIGNEERGFRGNQLTFYIAYLRDFGMNYSLLAESFETSVCWDNVLPLITNVKEKLIQEGKRLGVGSSIHVSSRITQIYDSGVCIYFYFCFNYQNMFPEMNELDRANEALKIHDKLDHLARREILAYGGSISHHHGVGKVRKKYLPQTVGPLGISVLQALKQNLDPNNVFACGNLFDVSKI